ncbi:hypothetical protein BJ546DRAFT_1060037 [Cryomyces antarcticus]
MSYYDNGTWPTPGRQPSWEQQSSRSGASATPQREEPTAFATQFEEVERALDNIQKSGKIFGGMPSRRESGPAVGGTPRSPYSDFDPRMGGSSRHHSISEYDGSRPSSASNLQNFYANQRFQPRQSEAEQMLQAKRRMAAQRERELRNYHQEQQYNRNTSGAKSDRSMSPNAMSEEDRRELIARQHRALYGDESRLYGPEGAAPRQSQDARVSANMGGARGASPLSFDPYGMQGQGAAESGVQMPPRDQVQLQSKDASAIPRPRSRANSNSSPSSNPTSFSLFENAQQSSRTSNSSPGGSPPLGQGLKSSATAGVAPIGTRPAQAPGQAASPALNKRSITPLPSPLSYGFSASEQKNNSNSNERSTSAASNPAAGMTDKVPGLGSWGSNSGSSPRPASPINSPPSTGASTARPSSPKPPGGPATAIRRKAAADRADKVANARPSSTRAAGAGGSSSTMLRLYTDESPGLKVDPVVVLVLSVGFIISVVALHVIAKITRRFSS